MASPEPSRATDDAAPSDLLHVIRASGILPDPEIEQIRARVLSGEFPFDAHSLARRLVRDGLLTEYQAARLLKNKPHGLSFGKYVILDKLGAGAMGRVYKARHLLMGRNVALKIIAPEISNNRRGVGRFRREMQLVGRLDHPNVVRAYDADQIGNTLYIVMEYVPGESLGQMLRRDGPLAARDVALYAAQAARGLGHAHAQGIVHRDVKPTNVLLGDDARVRVLDLGLGVLLEPDPQSAFMTADGIAVGTVDYMSPEQACGREVDGRSDIYSLGCAMFHLMTGQHVFPGENKVDRMLARVEGTPRQVSEFVADLPRGLDAVMARMLAQEPTERYQTAEEAAAALEALLRPRSMPRPPSGPPVRHAPSVPPPSAAPEVASESPASSEHDVETPSETDSGQFQESWIMRIAQALIDHPMLVLGLAVVAPVLAFLLGLVIGRAWRS
jgi:serine/threonine-protein kinase